MSVISDLVFLSRTMLHVNVHYDIVIERNLILYFAVQKHLGTYSSGAFSTNPPYRMYILYICSSHEG